MPSKSKKQSKATPSKPPSSQLSNPSSSSPSPQTPTPNSSQSHFMEDDLYSSIEEASRKFPTLIGKAAVIGQITDVDNSSQKNSCKIWLSEPYMVASSISSGSIVSVSLASLGRNSMRGFPLSLLAEEYSEQLGVDWELKMDDKAGNYFAIATVLPSRKLVKNGVRISSNLSHTLGCPSTGRIVFVHPIQEASLTSLIHGNGKLSSSNIDNHIPYHCKEVNIRLLPFKNGSGIDVDASTGSKKCSDKTPNGYENSNGKVSSPRTPLFEYSRPSSPSPRKLSLVPYEDSSSCLSVTKESSFDSVDVEEVLGDENSKKLLQQTAASWLYSRTLLNGNLVTVPVLSRLCLFEVVGAKILSADSMNQDSTQTFPLDLHTDEAFVVDRATKMHIWRQTDLALETLPLEKTGTLDQMKSRKIKIGMGDEVAKLGGLGKEYTLLRDIISSSMKNVLSSLGLRTTKGVLLYGPPGTGKTSLAQLCAHDAGVNFFKLNGPEVISQYYGESEQAIHDVFNSASQSSPSVIFIDELDAIAPARKEGGEELSQSMVATLLNLMDGISRTEGLLVIAATNRIECIEPALRRPGRLDREIEIGVPSPDQRLDILTTLLGRMQHSLSSDQIKQLAVVTHGFVGADLAALSNEAGMFCLRRYIKRNKSKDDSSGKGTVCNGSDGITETTCCHRDAGELLPVCHTSYLSSTNMELTVSTNSMSFPISEEVTVSCGTQEVVAESSECSSILKMTFEDFERARMKIRPSAMREVILEVPKVNWEDVGGQNEVKAQLMEAVEWPQKHQDAFKRIGTRPPTGVLMFGPPGCSKTLMARAVACEAGLNFLSVKGPELFSKWVGESEKAVRSLFARARANAPSIIFFDEIDSLAVIRGRESDGVSVADRVMSQLLVELDGLHERVNVTVIAATNRPDKIDPALLRPGRFDRLLYVGPPNETDRNDIFDIHLRKMPCNSDVDTSELARITEGCTGADISLICREAAISAIEENHDASKIKMEHLRNAILHVRPSESQPYQELSEKFQRLVYSKVQSDDLAGQPQLTSSKGRSSWSPVKWIPQLAHWFSATLSWQNASLNR